MFGSVSRAVLQSSVCFLLFVFVPHPPYTYEAQGFHPVNFSQLFCLISRNASPLFFSSGSFLSPSFLSPSGLFSFSLPGELTIVMVECGVATITLRKRISHRLSTHPDFFFLCFFFFESIPTALALKRVRKQSCRVLSLVTVVADVFHCITTFIFLAAVLLLFFAVCLFFLGFYTPLHTHVPW